jgi:uncharacterized protein
MWDGSPDFFVAPGPRRAFIGPTMTSQPTKPKLRFWLFGLLGAAPLLLALAVWLAGWKLARPGRREAGEAAQQILAGPAAFGLHVRPGRCGDHPYLLCTPDPLAGPAQRGGILRRQLHEAGALVPAYGYTTASVVLLHGRAGCKEDLLPVAERFCAAGLRCILIDLPGHGENARPASGFGAGHGESAIPGEVLDHAAGEFGFNPGQPAMLWGLSMGGSFALHAAAAEPERWAGVIVVCSFARLDDLVRRRCEQLAGPLATPVARLLAHGAQAAGGVAPAAVRPVAAAAALEVPALVVHGDADPLVPADQGRALFDALPGDRANRWLVVTGASHRDVLVTPQPVYAPMAAWLRDRR